MTQPVSLKHALGITAACVLAAPAAAQTWPERTVRIVVPFAAGGGTDIVTRILAEQLNKNVGNRFVVDNRGGAGGTLGAEVVAKAAPDGYTLLTSAFEMSINPTLRTKLPYDVFADFALISDLAHANYILACHPSMPIKSVKDLIALSKSRPGNITYGSSGLGGANHLTVELFTAMSGIKWLHVPFKGASGSVTALLSGDIDCTIASTSSIGPQVKTGRVRGLGVTGTHRAAGFPDLPTLNEAGVKGFVVNGWYGFYAPAGTPPAIIRTLSLATKRAIHAPEAATKLRSLGNEPVASSPQEFATLLRAEVDKWAKVIKQIGLNPIN